MFRLVLLGGLAVAAGLWSGVARAQGVGEGATVEMPSLGATVTVPANAGEWVVRKDGGGEALQRTKPVNPYLSIIFTKTVAAGAGASCSDAVSDYAKKGLKKADRPALVPAGWHAQLLAASSGNGELVIMFCAAEKDTLLVALVTYGGTIDSADLEQVTPMLESVGTAVFAAVGASGGGGVAPTGEPIGTEDDEPNRLVLPNTGMVLLLMPDGNTWEATAAADGKDLITRTSPADPKLAVKVQILRSTRRPVGGCEGILSQQVETEGSAMATKPRYLPAGFHEHVAESYKNGNGRALTCAEIPIGYLLATVGYGGSLDSEDASAAAPVLAGVLRAATKLSFKKDKKALFGGQNFMSPEVFLAGQSTSAVQPMSGPEISDGTGVMLGVRQAGVLPFADDSAFGLAGRYQFGIGWDGSNELLLDGMIGIGAGIIIEKRVTIMPLVGTGGDAIGAGSDEATAGERVKMDFDFYNYFGVVVAIEFTDKVGFEGTAAFLERGDNDETRYDGRFMVLPGSFRKLSIGLSYVDIDAVGTTWAVALGLGF